MQVYTGFFTAYSYAFVQDNRKDLDFSGRILLPMSVLRATADMKLSYPLIFEISSSAKGTKTFAGMLEFEAPEGQVIVPHWLMNALVVSPGETLKVRTVALPKGKLVKFRPVEAEFVELSNPRAVLTEALKNYSCLHLGDVIVFKHARSMYHLEIRELKSASGAAVEQMSIIDCDLSVDFERPLEMPPSPVRAAPGLLPAVVPTSVGTVIGGNVAPDGAGIQFDDDGSFFRPPSLTAPKQQPAPAPAAEPAQPSFVPFAGAGRSLSGATAPAPAPTPAGTTAPTAPMSLGAAAAQRRQAAAAATGAAPGFQAFTGMGRTLK